MSNRELIPVPSSETTTTNTQPNYNLSGILAKDTNTYKGVVIKYNQPQEARNPDRHWFLYPFKGEQALEQIPIYRQSAYLLGRDRNIADIPIDHISCSNQHAAIQFRFSKGKISPYIIDLDSANGTFLNSSKIEPRRYYELIEKDLLKFGLSSREYIVMSDRPLEN